MCYMPLFVNNPLNKIVAMKVDKVRQTTDFLHM